MHPQIELLINDENISQIKIQLLFKRKTENTITRNKWVEDGKDIN